MLNTHLRYANPVITDNTCQQGVASADGVNEEHPRTTHVNLHLHCNW